MSVLRRVLLPAAGATAALTVTGRALRGAFGERPREDGLIHALRERGGAATDRWTGIASFWSGIPQTVSAGAACCVAAYVTTRDIRATAAPAAALVLETSVFLVSSALVGRPRPDVYRPDRAHATSSFPSGHTAAATALNTVVADLLDRTGHPAAAVSGPVLRWVNPGLIAFSRVYRGQHHPTDVVAGLLLGRWSARLVRRTVLTGTPKRPPVE